MEGYKDGTKKSYDGRWYDKARRFVDDYLQEETALFLKKLPGKFILDIGCGPGHHAASLKKN